MTEPIDRTCAICGDKATHAATTEVGGEMLLCTEHALRGIFKPHVREENGALIFEQRPGAVVTEAKHEPVAIEGRSPTFIVEIDSGIDEWVRVLSPGEPMDGLEDESQAWALARKLHGKANVRVRAIEHEPSAHPVDVLVDLATQAGTELDPERVAEARAICDAPVGWSSNPPTRPGWYWNRTGPNHVPEPQNVVISLRPKRLWVQWGDAECAPVEEFGGEWFSEPIAEPPA